MDLFRLTLGILAVILFVPAAQAGVANLPFTSCFSGDATDQLAIETVYAQVLGQPGDFYMNLTVVGNSPNGITGYNTDSGGALSTLFTTTDVLTLNVEESAMYFCSTLNPSPLGAMNDASNTDPSHPPRYCPLSAGPFAFSSSISFGSSNRALTTLSTRLRAVDPSGLELFCIDVLSTSVDANLAGNDGQMGEPNGHYGQAIYIFYVSIALSIAYFLLTSLARLTAAWGRGLYHSSGIPRAKSEAFWARVQSAGYILASAISGEKLSTSPSLLRFCTPSAKDVVLHTQFCAILAMIRVQWPGFIYPLLTQASWATLAYNISLSDTVPRHYNPTSPPTLSPDPIPFPSTFADQFTDPLQPIYIETSAPNILMVYPHNNTNDGLEKFAYALGIRPQDLFPAAIVVFLGAIGGTIAMSLLFWAIDLLGTSALGSTQPGRARRDSAGFTSGTRSPLPFTNGGAKDGADNAAAGGASPALGPGSFDGHTSLNLFRPPSKFNIPGLGSGSGDRSATPGPSRGIGGKRWWKKYLPPHSGLSSFHFSVLHGNLVRLLALFHLPITVFSTYQMVLPIYSNEDDDWEIATSGALKVLAALSFAVFSVVLPASLLFRIFKTPTNKLFSETRTLLSLGPLYNLYSQGNQTFALLYFGSNLVFGTVLGASQGATPSTSFPSSPGQYGLAQAIVLLICEIIGAVVTSIWLPWGLGAGMGLWSFLACVGRIVIAVMVLILSSIISIGAGPGAWVAYGILVLVALQYLAFIVAFFIKLIEAIVRLITRQPFRTSTSSLDAGLLGACCIGRNKKRRRRRQGPGHRYTKTSDNLLGTTHQLRSANVASFDPPPPLGGGGLGSSIHSGRSGPPPSVLRPEQANNDYNSEEDAREEISRPGSAGFIMGAWKPEGYEPVSSENEAAVSPPAAKSTGFSRVGGGRAKMDNPYSAIPTSSTTPTAKSTAPAASQTSLVQPAGTSYNPPPSSPVLPPIASTSSPPSAFPSRLSPLPPGAAQPAQPAEPSTLSSHTRTKSQTAIVEHFAPVIPQPTSNLAAYSTPVFTDDDEPEEEGPSQGGKKKWNLFGRKSRASTGAIPSPTIDMELGGNTGGRPSTGDRGASEGGGSSSSSTPQRSFVVIRKGQPGGSSLPAGK